jgi:hypothetical protein
LRYNIFHVQYFLTTLVTALDFGFRAYYDVEIQVEMSTIPQLGGFHNFDKLSSCELFDNYFVLDLVNLVTTIGFSHI